MDKDCFGNRSPRIAWGFSRLNAMPYTFQGSKVFRWGGLLGEFGGVNPAPTWYVQITRDVFSLER